MQMRRPTVLALFLASLGTAGAASAQPGNQPPSAPAPQKTGHRGIVLSAALAMAQQYGGHPEAQGGGLAAEAFVGWAFGRWAVMAWGRARVTAEVSGFADLGVAGRTWLPAVPRLYAELRAGYEQHEISHWEDEFEGSPYRTGAVLGGGVGLELFTSPRFTIDGRATIERGITADTPDYSLATLGLAMQVY
jgi:hypothetical protein